MPEEEGDRRSLRIGSGMGDLYWYFCDSFEGIVLSEWK